jgi:phenylacetate-coenzyme A ligase PaaK-like adenylate-forming protein
MTAMTPLEGWTAARLGLVGKQLDRRLLESYQLEKLTATIRFAAANSPFYRKHLGQNATAGLRTLADLTGLPFTDASDLRRYGSQMVCVSQSQINRVVTLDTSGTVGDPKRLWFTAEDQNLTVDFFQAGMATLTRPGDRVLILLPGRRPGSVGALLARALAGMGMMPLPYEWSGNLVDAANFLQHERVDSVVGSPVQVLALALFSAERGGPLPCPRTVLLSTDYAPHSLIREVERIWNCRVFDHYGMTEMGLGGGVECEAHAGYHLREMDLFFEIVDPQTGERLPDGCEGEVVFSTLTRRGMPLIRYRTGDLSRFLPEPCGCGSVLKRLDRLGGRLDSILRLPAAELRIGEIAEAIFAVPGVLDYAVTALPEKERLILAVVVWSLGSPATTQTAVNEELGRIGPLREAREAGRLAVVVRCNVCAGVLPPGPAKRSFGKVM